MMGDLSTHFSREEFACQCGCGRGFNDGDISPDLILHLESMRSKIGRPIIILSGCRCPPHNSNVGGVLGSVHTMLPLEASDLRVYPGAHQHAMTKAAFSEGVMGYGVKFGSYIHVDWHNGSVLSRPAIWGY